MGLVYAGWNVVWDLFMRVWSGGKYEGVECGMGLVYEGVECCMGLVYEGVKGWNVVWV